MCNCLIRTKMLVPRKRPIRRNCKGENKIDNSIDTTERWQRCYLWLLNGITNTPGGSAFLWIHLQRNSVCHKNPMSWLRTPMKRLNLLLTVLSIFHSFNTQKTWEQRHCGCTRPWELWTQMWQKEMYAIPRVTGEYWGRGGEILLLSQS